MLSFIKIEVKFSSDKQPQNPFLGSTLRGAFGYALKQIVCVNYKYKCAECLSNNSCLFYDFYEAKNSYHKYRFSKPIGEDNYDFAFYLYEGVCEKLPYILNAFYEMAANCGFGFEREKAAIKTISCNGVVVYENDKFNMPAISPSKFEIKDISDRCRLQFITPLRMKADNLLLRSKPTLEQILISIYNRLNSLKDIPLSRLPFEPLYKEGKSEIRFTDFSRYSNRQQTKMQLGGIMGFVEYTAIDPNSFALLQLGEITGAGKQTVFGLGELKISAI
ncbi:hypothetical protein AGMMS50229_15850 [Campylobacterota bacterium]|nr:hypothetical protein AGMMS50229_15850 [Campylobacterota bacterium]